MIFSYDKKFLTSKYCSKKTQFENYIKDYVYNNFYELNDDEIEFILIPSNMFKETIYAKAIPEKGIIKLNFDDWEKFFDSKFKMLSPSVQQKNTNLLMNTMYHELVHIYNFKSRLELFNVIDDIEGYNYIKGGSKIFLDEYIATYESQKKYFFSQSSKTYFIDEVRNIKESRMKWSDNEKCRRFLEFAQILGYSLAEYVVSNKDGKNEEYVETLRQVFGTDITNLLISIVMEYENVEIKKLAYFAYRTLEVGARYIAIDFDFLKEIDKKR